MEGQSEVGRSREPHTSKHRRAEAIPNANKSNKKLTQRSTRRRITSQAGRGLNQATSVLPRKKSVSKGKRTKGVARCPYPGSNVGTNRNKLLTSMHPTPRRLKTIPRRREERNDRMEHPFHRMFTLFGVNIWAD